MMKGGLGLNSLHSELNERLEYLVNYSSQLVFVSGDSVSQQQKNLEAFIYQQHDDTEIAFLTADVTMQSSDYRGQLCRQLLGQVVGSFTRPLNELLAPLNNHEGPILVAITQAQHLSDSLLQELWDLVLQSRFAGNKQHLNVLLFADSEWAEKAKQWLPAKNSDTPLLISSQSIVSEPAAISDLDKMMMQRREAFQAHLDKRNLPTQVTSTNLLKTKRFYFAIGAVFFLTFGGLITWQYGDAISSLFNPIEGVSQPEQEAILPGSAFEKVLSSPQDPSLLSSSLPNNQSMITSSEDDLAADWHTAISAIDTSIVEESETSTLVTHVSVDQPDTGQPLDVTDDAPVASEAVTHEEAPNVTLETSTDKQKPIATSTDMPNNNPWLAPSDFVIQLVGMQDEVALQQFIERNNLNNVTHVYQTLRYDAKWHVVLFHQPFDSLAEAKSALSVLPDYPTKKEAFIKRGQQVLDEIALLSL